MLNDMCYFLQSQPVGESLFLLDRLLYHHGILLHDEIHHHHVHHQNHHLLLLDFRILVLALLSACGSSDEPGTPGPTSRPVARDASPEDALRIIYTAMLEIYSRAQARGCLVFSTAVAEAPAHPEIRSRLAQRLVQTDAQFRRLFDHIAPDAPEGARQAAAEMAAAVLHSLGLRVRAGTEADDVHGFIANAARSIAAGLTP